MGMKLYRVRISYLEPLFCRTIGKSPETLFTSEVSVEAEDRLDAIRAARAEFNAIAGQSWVHWERQIVDCQIVSEPGC